MSNLFILEPFKKEHVIPLLAQEMNAYLRSDFEEGMAEDAEEHGSFTGFMNGKIVVCGGVYPYWSGRGGVWTMFSAECKENFVPVFRGIKVFLQEQLKTYRRIEATIPCDFTMGRRRALMLGFVLECERMKNFLPDGQDCALYALVRKD